MKRYRDTKTCHSTLFQTRAVITTASADACSLVVRNPILQCLEDYQKEMKDPTTTERRREELESEVQEQKMEMRDNKRVIANIEAELQGINLETEGKL